MRSPGARKASASIAAMPPSQTHTTGITAAYPEKAPSTLVIAAESRLPSPDSRLCS